MSLPPLPAPFRKQGQQMSYDGCDKAFFDCYSSDQMQAYGQQCRAEALEEAAIDAERFGHLWSGAPAKAFFELAEKIRSMK